MDDASTPEKSEESLEICVPIPIDTTILEDIVPAAKDWALMHGAAMRSKSSFDSDTLYFAPFILTPSPFPRKEFKKAIDIQTILNELMHRVAHDYEFLRNTLAETIKFDDFTRKLFELYEHVIKSGYIQPVSLGILRSDIMLEKKCPNEVIVKPSKAYCCWKQVEINTIASGFGHLGPASKDLQSFVLRELNKNEILKNLPENTALHDICGGMIKAWKRMENPSGVILFVIEDISYNICDQRFHEFELKQQNPNIKVIRRSLTQIYNHGKLGDNKELIVNDQFVNVVYFRSGYEPGQYHTKNEWMARYLIECSNAIKCPSIQYHLAGTKKVQQALAAPGILKRFLKDEKKIEAVKEIFTGLYTLDQTDAGQAAYKMALADPERFVLKPQREGGGNNVYGFDIPDVLRKMSALERASWILMERIHPPITKGYMIRPGGSIPPPVVDLVSELGIFGVIIGDPHTIYENYQAGHMLRTKLSSANEGGVAAGLGALDSPYLVD